MSEYRIELRPAAARALRRPDPPVARRLQGAISLPARDPRPPAARPLKGRLGLRLRVGDYRIIYTIEDDILLIVVVTVGHRRDVYDLITTSESTSSGRSRAGRLPSRP